jgi:hypothetical protein
LGKQNDEDCEEKKEHLEIGNDRVDHCDDVAQTLVDPQIEETLDDLLDEYDGHQYFVVQRLRVCRVLRNHIHHTAPHVKLVTIILDFLEVFGYTRLVQLGQIVPHWEDDSQNKQDTEEIRFLRVIVDVNGVYIN